MIIENLLAAYFSPCFAHSTENVANFGRRLGDAHILDQRLQGRVLLPRRCCSRYFADAASF